MKKLEKWTGQKTYMYPNGELATPERINADFPAGLHFTHVIETDESGQVCFAFMNLSALRSQYEIDIELSEDDAIAEIEAIINTPEPEPEPSAEERIAAAMEYQNLFI
jgi:hypothetical protein